MTHTASQLTATFNSHHIDMAVSVAAKTEGKIVFAVKGGYMANCGIRSVSIDAGTGYTEVRESFDMDDMPMMSFKNVAKFVKAVR